MDRKRVDLVFGILVFLLLVGVFGALLNVPMVKGDSGTVHIRADGSIDPPDAPISTLDNVTHTLTGNITSDVDGIYLSFESMNNTFRLNTIRSNNYGVYFQSLSYGENPCDNNTLASNIIMNNSEGIRFEYCTNSMVTNNTVSNNAESGIVLFHSNGCLVDNHMSNNGEYSIAISSASGNCITKNVISNSDYGIDLYASSDNILKENALFDNQYAIHIWISSNNNSVYENSMSENSVDVYLAYVSKTSIFHNSLINSGNHTLIQESSDSIWDDGYPSGGNYWSNYNGTDANHDGIGEIAYVIDANNTDRYPLIGVFSDFSITSEHHVQTVCNSSISSFQYDDSSINFNVTGEDGTAGFCRICIPTDLMNVTYRVFVNGTEVQYDLLPFSNRSHSYLCFTYSHSTKEIVVVPEFTPLVIVSLFMMATLLAAIAYKRKRPPLQKFI